MKAKGVNRVLIAVRDVEEASKRYSSLLGIRFWDAGVQEDFGVRAMVSWEGGVELIAPLDTDSRVARFLEKNGESIYGVAFNVTDIDRAVTAARQKGIRITHTIDQDQSGKFKLFKEVCLHPAYTDGIFMLLVQSQSK